MITNSREEGVCVCGLPFATIVEAIFLSFIQHVLKLSVLCCILNPPNSSLSRHGTRLGILSNGHSYISTQFHSIRPRPFHYITFYLCTIWLFGQNILRHCSTLCLYEVLFSVSVFHFTFPYSLHFTFIFLFACKQHSRPCNVVTLAPSVCLPLHCPVWVV